MKCSGGGIVEPPKLNLLVIPAAPKPTIILPQLFGELPGMASPSQALFSSPAMDTKQVLALYVSTPHKSVGERYVILRIQILGSVRLRI